MLDTVGALIPYRIVAAIENKKLNKCAEKK